MRRRTERSIRSSDLKGTSSQSLAPVGDTNMEEISRVKDGIPTDEELEELGVQIGENWKKLGRRLVVPGPELMEIGHAHDLIPEKGYFMLKHWKQEKGSAATYQALCDALKHKVVQRRDLAEQFCYIHVKSCQLPVVHVQEEKASGEVIGASAGVYIGTSAQHRDNSSRVKRRLKRKSLDPNPERGKLSFKIYCSRASSRNSGNQDLQEEREKVNRYMEKIIDEVKSQKMFNQSTTIGIRHFCTYLLGELHLMDVNFERSSTKVIVKCGNLEILEDLWHDYFSGHLNEVAEESIITEEVKEELGMETIKLKTTILEEDYVACKLSLMEISGADTFKEGKPSDLELDDLALEIGAKWKRIGIRLGVSNDVLEGIVGDTEAKPFQMLLHWRNTTTSATPYHDLYYALCHSRVGLSNVAKEFCWKEGSRSFLKMDLPCPSENHASAKRSRSEALALRMDLETSKRVEHKIQERTVSESEGSQGPERQEASAVPVSSGQTQASCTGDEAHQVPNPIHLKEIEVLCKIAENYLRNSPLRKKADCDDLVAYMKAMGGILDIDYPVPDWERQVSVDNLLSTVVESPGVASTEGGFRPRRNLKLNLSVEGLDTKSESKMEAELSGEGHFAKSESHVKIDLSQETLETKSEKREINRTGVVWELQGIQAAAFITFPSNAVTQPVLFICTLLEDPMHHPPLKKDEALVSDVIQLSFHDPHGSDFTGDFGEMVSVALSHSAINLRGYEIVIRELVDSHNNNWRDLDTTNTWPASGERPFAEAKVTSCSSFAVVCRLKSYTYTALALENRDFTFTIQEYPDVSVTVPASVVHANKELQLDLKVQEIPRQWYEDSGVIVGPILRITCSPEIRLLDPATITLPFSLEDNNECAELSSGNLIVLLNSYEEDENETNPKADWEDITSQLSRPAHLENGVVTFQVEHFSWYTILWEREKTRNKKRKRIGFRNTGRKRNAFRITGRIPQAGCFFAHLSCVKTEHLPPGWYNLHHFCCPLHKVSRVEEIIRTAEGVILFGGGESQEPLCVDDEIHISLQNGLEADERTQDDQTQLRFKGDRPFERYLMVRRTGKQDTPIVDFYRRLDFQSRRIVFTCIMTKSFKTDVTSHSGTPTDEQLERISQNIGQGWKSLGRRLKMSKSQLEAFDKNNAEYSEKPYQMLLCWKQRDGKAATYQVLHNALCHDLVNRRDLAEGIC